MVASSVTGTRSSLAISDPHFVSPACNPTPLWMGVGQYRKDAIILELNQRDLCPVIASTWMGPLTDQMLLNLR